MADNDTKIVIGGDASGALSAINNVIGKMPGLSAAITGGFSVAAITAFVKSSIDAADHLNDLSQKIGISVETLAGLQLAAAQNGLSLESMATGVKKLSVYMTEHGDKLRKVGIDAKTADGAMLQLADLFSKMPDGVQKTALAVELFGKAGTDMIPMLNQGSVALGGMIEKGKQLNPITTEMAKQADLFNDQMEELKLHSAGVGTSLTNSLLPALNAIISRLNEGTQATGSFIGGMRALALAGVSEEELDARIARNRDLVESGRLSGSDSSDYEQALRLQEAEKNRRRGERSAEIVAGLGPIDSREGKSFSDRQSMAAAAAARSLLGKPGKDGKVDPDIAKRKSFEERIQKDRQKEAGTPDDYDSADLAAGREARDAAMLAADAELQDQLTAQRRMAFEMRMVDLEASFMTEQEMEQSFHAGRMATLESARADAMAQREGDFEAQLEVQQRFAGIMEQEKIRHLAKLGNDEAQAAIRRKNFASLTAMQQASEVANTLTSHLALASQKYKAFFYIHKLASIAQAYINTSEGVTKALSWGPIGMAFAPIIAAAGAANIAIIAAQKFEGGGGGSPGSVGGGYAAPIAGPGGFDPPAPPQAPLLGQAEAARQVVNIQFNGGAGLYKMVADELIPVINEAVGNGVDIRVVM